MKKFNLLKIKFSFLILIFIIGFVNTQVGSDEKLEESNWEEKLLQYFKICRNLIFNIFKKSEDYFIKFHSFLVADIELQYPFDLVFFFMLGLLLFYTKSCFSFKREYIYNSIDQQDLTYLLNNVKKMNNFRNLIN